MLYVVRAAAALQASGGSFQHCHYSMPGLSMQDHNLAADHQRIAVRLESVFDDAIKALSAVDGLQWSGWKAEQAGAPASVEILQASKVRGQ